MYIRVKFCTIKKSTGFILLGMSITFKKKELKNIGKKWISRLLCTEREKTNFIKEELNEWAYFRLKENDMILSRFMWLELLSKSNILRPILLCDEVYNSIMRERERERERESRSKERERVVSI